MKKTLPHQEAAIREFAIEAIIKGYSNDELTDILVKDYPNVEGSEIHRLIIGSHFKIRDATLTDLDKIIPLHIELYEKIYQEMDDLYCMPGKLRALRQKENIVGLHKEQNTVDVYNEVNVEIEQDSQYDLTKLKPEEQKRLEALLQKVMSK